jgi:peptidylprolyl isomerase
VEIEGETEEADLETGTNITKHPPEADPCRLGNTGRFWLTKTIKNEKIPRVENEIWNRDDSVKNLLIFFGIIIGLVCVVLLVRQIGSKNIEDLSIKPVGDERPLITVMPEESPNMGITPETTSSGKEIQDMPDQKMTVEQKLAVKAPIELIDITKKYTATLKTSMGDIVIALDAKSRPQTVNSFVYLSKMGFYDDVVFHRIIPNFMIQGGDPLGTGTGGPAYKFADELTAPNTNAKGTISMANAGPNTNGSQFFINLINNNHLDSKHTVFGNVTQGMDVVEAIGKVQTGANDKPITSIIIMSVEIKEE